MAPLRLTFIGQDPDERSGRRFQTAGAFALIVLFLLERHGEQVVPDSFIESIQMGRPSDEGLSQWACNALTIRLEDWLGDSAGRFLAMSVGEELAFEVGDEHAAFFALEECSRFLRFLRHCGGFKAVVEEAA